MTASSASNPSRDEDAMRDRLRAFSDDEKTRTVLRFSVASTSGSRSMSWRVWTGSKRPTDEVYVAPRHMAGDLKFSLHSSGYRQIGPTSRVRRMSSPDDREALSKWMHNEPNAGPILRLLIQRSELRPRASDPSEMDVVMLDHEDALLIAFSVDDAFTRRLSPAARVAGRLDRASGEPLLIVAAPVEPRIGFTREVRRMLKRPNSTWALPVGWKSVPYGFAEIDDGDTTPLLIEFAVDDSAAVGQPPWFSAFPGTIETMDRSPVAAPSNLDICAGLFATDARTATLFVNEHARCDHGSMINDVLGVLDAFRTDGPDSGWDRVRPADGQEGGWFTAIVTSATVDRLGLEPDDPDSRG